MSPDLVELDKDLRELDEKARKKTLNEPELGNWYQMWAAWDQMYNFWLDGFPSKGIVIDKKDEMEDLPGSLRLQIENPWSLPDYKRPTNLPLHLKRHEDLMNSLSSTPDILNDSERAYLDQLLAPLFRPTLKNFRRLALEHVQKICKRAARDPEDDALMETLISLAHSILEEAVFMSTAARRIQIREQVPGAYEVIVVNSSNNPTFPTSEANENDLAEGMFRQLCASHLEASKIEFHDTAFWIRTEKNLGQGAANFLQHNIPNISSQHILALRTRVLEIMSSNGSGEAEKDQAQKDLAQAITRLCWKQLMMMHPDQDKKILDLIGTPTLSIRTPALVARRLQGASPLAPPPLVIPPSEADIKAVEIEINNLIRAVKSNPVDKELGEKLCYLLRALLPPRLRFLKSRIEILDAQYLARDGLGIMDSLQFADAQKQFEPLFQLWQQSITGLGIVLDNWLSTPEAISEVCSRARQWRVFNFGPDSGIISDKLEDGDVQQCQEIYAAFRRFVEYGCQDGDGVDDQILLRSTPADVRYQIKQIQKRILLAQEVTNDEKKTQYAMVLHTLQVQLMKSYMRWLTSLTPMRRQTFRGQIRGNYDSSTNFTPKAERRGIKRAAVELALNLLATNQEQHRPKDRFRMVDLPSQVQLPEREVALCLPLKPEDRPLEQDPLEYTKKMLAFRRWKDYDYGIARVRSSTDQNGELPPPENFNGPTSIASVDNVHAAARTQITDLALIQKGLIEAQNTAPRPLIEQLLLLTDAGLNYTEEQDHALYDDELLKSDGVDLLEEIAGASWDEERREYGEEIPGVQNTPDARGRLEEFERDLAELSKQLPPWQPDVDPDAMDEDGFELFLQPDYDPEILSEHGMLIGQVRQIIGNNRLAKSSSTAGTSPPLNSNDVTRYLKAMASARRIHIDEYDNGDIYVSKIPLSGHPENKYVVSREEAPTSAGVYREKDGKLQVRYDSFGRVGPPILQPNKYHYLRVLAFRLGRDLRKNAEVLANPERGLGERVQEQQTSRSLAEKEMENILPADRSGGAYITNLVDPPQRNITLQRMAQDLLKIAPDLAQEAGFRIASPTDITEQQAAILLQMQLLEEANNNWEWKFPENEHVWDFAAVRLEKTTRIINGRSIEGRPRLAQYFHMRRFAPCYLSEATKTIIKASGPTIQEEPVPTEMTDEHDADPGEKKVRHIKGREPYFSLGESAYERAFLSWRMEQELKEIPEFQRPKKRRSWWSFGKGNKDDDDQDLPKDRYPLPKIPAHWIPDSVSIAQKRAHVLELAKEDEAFPNPEILEYFHTPAEIQQINIQRQWDLFAMKRQVADAAVEQHTGKKFDRLSQEELNKAYKELGINQLNGIFNDDPKSVPIDNKKRTAQQAAPAGTMKLRKRGGREIRTAVI
ncbi:hypothetical protein N431DRAFT_77764 [Stipitochalara longipes BDJ]|nr:hypothetical protein N431DRAFT_77764 [Stipitochalara longipes BDJ]